MIWSYQKW